MPRTQFIVDGDVLKESQYLYPMLRKGDKIFIESAPVGKPMLREYLIDDIEHSISVSGLVVTYYFLVPTGAIRHTTFFIEP